MITKEQIEKNVEEFVNRQFLEIQNKLGVTTGDEASYWFSGSKLEAMQEQMVEEFLKYQQHELDNWWIETPTKE